MNPLDLPAPVWGDSLETVRTDGEIVVVAARLSDWAPAHREAVEEILSEDERARANRFAFPADARRHLLGRLVARSVAGRLTGRSPAELQFERGPHGKPQLADRSLAFNISHGGEVVLGAFARNGPVGIDVEPRERTSGEGGLARSVLTDVEFARWRGLPEAQRARFFMHVWTVKEALIKASGEGLARDPTTVTCQFDGKRVVGLAQLVETESDLSAGMAEDWNLYPFDVDAEAVACLAWPRTEGGGERSLSFGRFCGIPGRDGDF